MNRGRRGDHESSMINVARTPKKHDFVASSIEEELAGISSIQVLLKGNLKPTPLRSIKSEHMNKLLKCPGIVISTSPVKNRAVQLKVRCSSCNEERTVFSKFWMLSFGKNE